MKDFLGIIGGVGTLASAYFYELLASNTEVSCDQDHINMIILNHAEIPDRTDFILGKSEYNPLDMLKCDVHMLTDLGAKIIFIPCNTCHFFYEELQKETRVPILNMIKDTATYLKDKNIKKVAILATRGTIESRLYQKECENASINYVLPDDVTLNKIMKLIYNSLKCGKKINDDAWQEIINYYGKVDAYILGCTELSMLKRKLNLKDEFIDPLEIETSKIIKIFGKKDKQVIDKKSHNY